MAASIGDMPLGPIWQEAGEQALGYKSCAERCGEHLLLEARLVAHAGTGQILMSLSPASLVSVF